MSTYRCRDGQVRGKANVKRAKRLRRMRRHCAWWTWMYFLAGGTAYAMYAISCSDEIDRLEALAAEGER